MDAFPPAEHSIPARKVGGWKLAIEYFFVATIVAGIGYVVYFYINNLYLPQPFFYEPSGVFMDWYSLSYYGNHPGAYNVAGTIYPPLSFVIMKFASESACYQSTTGELSRACDPWGVVALISGLLLNVVLTFLTFRKLDRATAFPRAFALGLGLPMLYAFERGNMILFTYTCVLLGFGPLLKSARLRWLFAGAAINFKVYLIGAALAPLLHRRWMQTEGILLSMVLVYLGTWAILGEGSPNQIIENVTFYGKTFGASRILDMWYPSSFIPAISLLKGTYFPISTLLDSRVSDALLVVCLILQHSAQLMILLAAAAIWLRPEAVPRHRSVFFAIAMALATSEAGGYTQIILLLFVFMERWRGIALPTAIIIAYLLCIPAEWVVAKVPPMVRWSYLANRDIIATYGVGVFAILRPILGIFIIWLLSAVTIRDVWSDYRKRGVKPRLRPAPHVQLPPAAAS